MRYERPAIEARFQTGVLLGTPISDGGGDLQPVWRSEKAAEDSED